MGLELTLAEINDLTSEGRTTMYKPTIIEFDRSGEVYLDVRAHFPFNDPKKKVDSIFNSFNSNVKLLKAMNPAMADIIVKKKNGTVLLINVDALKGQLADPSVIDGPTDEQIAA